MEEIHGGNKNIKYPFNIYIFFFFFMKQMEETYKQCVTKEYGIYFD